LTDFFILAGGFGKRAMPLTDFLPKPIFPLDGIPLLKIIGQQLLDSGFKKGFINIHHLASKITKCKLNDLKIDYLEENILSGNKILSSVAELIENDLLVINGDTFLEIPIKKLFIELKNSESDGVILVRKKTEEYPSIVTDNGFYVKRDRDPNLTDIMYAGVSIFRNGFLHKLQEENFFDSIELSGSKFQVMEYGGPWLDLGTPKNYFQANKIFRKMKKKNSGNSISKNVKITNNVKIENSIIWENTKISGKSIIKDSIITGSIHIHNKNFTKKIVTKNGIYNL